MADFPSANASGLTSEQTETLLHFVYNPATDLLEGDRSIQTLLASLMLGDQWIISSGGDALSFIDGANRINYFPTLRGVKDQEVVSNQDVTGLIREFTRKYSDNLLTLEPNGPASGSGVTTYDEATTTAIDNSVYGQEVIVEETIEPADVLIFQVFRGTDDTGQLGYEQRLTNRTLTTGDTLVWWFTNPVEGMAGTQIFSQMLLAKGGAEGPTALLSVRRSVAGPTVHYVLAQIRTFADKLIVDDSVSDGTGEPIAKAKNDSTLPFKTLTSSGTIVLSSDADEVNMESLFGSEYQFESDESESTTTSTSFQNKLTLTTPTIPAGTYRGEITCEVTNDSGDKPVVTEVTLNGNTFNESFYAPKFEDEYILKTSFTTQFLTAGIYEIDLNFRSTSEGGRAKIRRARIELFRVA